jgi:hypothetical protein
MSIKPGPGVILKDVDGKRLYYTYLQYYKAQKLTTELQKRIELGEKIDDLSVIKALGRCEMELISSGYNPKSSVRFLKDGEE